MLLSFVICFSFHTAAPKALTVLTILIRVIFAPSRQRIWNQATSTGVKGSWHADLSAVGHHSDFSR